MKALNILPRHAIYALVIGLISVFITFLAFLTPLNISTEIVILCLILNMGSLLYLAYLLTGSSTNPFLVEIINQLRQINLGRQDNIVLQHCPESLKPLLDELQSHLAMETERLIQEQNFSADASHELRTPLTGMRLQAQIAMRLEDPQQRDNALLKIISAVDRSARMVEQLLVYSRLTRRRTLAENNRVDVVELVQNQLIKFSSLANAKALKVETSWPENGQVKLQLHRDQFVSALDNLILNAIQHSPEKGVVRIQVIDEKNKISTIIEDNGPGLNDQDKQRVRIPFQKSDSDQQKGTGLGVAIAEKVAQLHAGQLQLEDSTLGGLRVTLVLPYHN